MKAVIVAGGLGTRISEETTLHPEPMVEIGGRPILKIYSHPSTASTTSSSVATSATSSRSFLANYYSLNNSDVMLDMKTNQMAILNSEPGPGR